jgi:hypothetical protein
MLNWTKDRTRYRVLERTNTLHLGFCCTTQRELDQRLCFLQGSSTPSLLVRPWSPGVKSQQGDVDLSKRGVHAEACISSFDPLSNRGSTSVTCKVFLLVSETVTGYVGEEDGHHFRVLTRIATRLSNSIACRRRCTFIRQYHLILYVERRYRANT